MALEKGYIVEYAVDNNVSINLYRGASLEIAMKRFVEVIKTLTTRVMLIIEILKRVAYLIKFYCADTITYAVIKHST